MRWNLMCGLLFVCVGAAVADDSPQFLGAGRNGVLHETGLVAEFGDDGPKQLWRSKLGVSMSGLAVVGDEVFTLYQDGAKQFVVALKLADGEVIWKTAIGENYKNSMGNGPRATPTVVDGVVYAFSGDGVLAALKAQSGVVLWSVNTVGTLKTQVADYGMASSPLVTEHGVVVQVGSPNGCVCCFNKATGERKWAAGDELAGYSSPIMATLAGVKQVVAVNGAEVLSLDPATGAVLWEFPFVTEYNCNTASPVVLDADRVLISAGENHGSVVLKVTGSGKSLAVSEDWSSLGRGSVLRAEWQTPVLAEGVLYGFDNIGSAGPITNLVAVDAATGKQLWMEKRFGKGNLVMADGRVYITTMKGELVVGTVTPEGYEETARAVLTGMTRQAPVISGGHLLMRDDAEVVCIDLRAN
ncbi:MAG: PQQ-binding-like beta-propeller repeat protein [Planctomycetaceae bacterium]|nr:PQQ-binding-like beta-propeller repeat protein [Planctomycetaceae bacterium]